MSNSTPGLSCFVVLMLYCIIFGEFCLISSVLNSLDIMSYLVFSLVTFSFLSFAIFKNMSTFPQCCIFKYFNWRKTGLTFWCSKSRYYLQIFSLPTISSVTDSCNRAEERGWLMAPGLLGTQVSEKQLVRFYHRNQMQVVSKLSSYSCHVFVPAVHLVFKWKNPEFLFWEGIWNSFPLTETLASSLEIAKVNCWVTAAPHHLQRLLLLSDFASVYLVCLALCCWHIPPFIFTHLTFILIAPHTPLRRAPCLLLSNSWSILYLLKVIWCFQSLCFAKDLAFISLKQS